MADWRVVITLRAGDREMAALQWVIERWAAAPWHAPVPATVHMERVEKDPPA